MKIKYVVFGENHAVLVPNTMFHSDVRCSEGRATSAGFCAVQWDENECKFKADVWGESISLGLKSKPEDAFLVARVFNGN